MSVHPLINAAFEMLKNLINCASFNQINTVILFLRIISETLITFSEHSLRHVYFD